MQASGFADLYNTLGVGLYGSFQLAACERRRSRLAGARGLLTSATDASPNEPECRSWPTALAASTKATCKSPVLDGPIDNMWFFHSDSRFFIVETVVKTDICQTTQVFLLQLCMIFSFWSPTISYLFVLDVCSEGNSSAIGSHDVQVTTTQE